jgi:hypothetical protein
MGTIKRRIQFLMLVTILAFSGMLYVGCQQSQDGHWRLDPFAADQIEKAGDTATGALSLLSLFVPGAAGVAGIAAGATAAFKKMKPGLTKYKNTSQHIVTTVEKIKKSQPELWAKIKDEFKDGTNADIEAVIDQIVAMAKVQEKQNGC